MKKSRSRSRHRTVATTHTVAPGPASRPEPAIAPASPLDRRVGLLAVPLVLLVVAAFWPALGNGFVDWDDEPNFLENYHFRGLGWPQLQWAWTTFLLGVYQPVAWMILECEYALFGLDPRGYHLVSLVLHAAVAVALYALILDLLGRARDPNASDDPRARVLGAFTATALFVLHPLRVEAVAWASCQPYLPCALFSLLAVLAYLRAHDDAPAPRRRAWLATSLVLYAAALLSKAAAVPLPAVLVILDVYPLRRIGGPVGWLGPRARRAWIEKAPFFALGLLFAALAIRARSAERSLVALEHDGIAARVAQACYAVGFYVVKTIIPADIAAFYPLSPRIDPTEPRFLAAIAATLGLTAALLLMRRRHPGWLAAWLSYLVILAPSSGLMRTGNHVAADRYSYLAMTGLAVLLAAGLDRLWAFARRSRAAAIGLVTTSLAASLALVPLTRAQCRTWHDSEALWSHSLAHGGVSSEVERSLGEAYFRQGRLDEAMARFDEAVRLNPGFSMAWRGRGAVAFRRGQFGEAIANFNEAIRLDPIDPIPHYHAGIVRFTQGWSNEALAEFAEAIRLNPELPEAHYGAGNAWSRMGHHDRAIAELREAIRLKPDHAEAYNELAMILAACPDPRFRDGRAAVAAATRACDLAGRDQPDYLDTLAAAHAEAGDFEAAVKWQETAINLLADQARKDDFRTRLALYQSRRPFRTPTAPVAHP